MGMIGGAVVASPPARRRFSVNEIITALKQLRQSSGTTGFSTAGAAPVSDDADVRRTYWLRLADRREYRSSRIAPSRRSLRFARRRFYLVGDGAQPLGLWIKLIGDNTGSPLCRHQYRTQCDPAADVLGALAEAGRDVEDQRRCPQAAGRISGLRFHRHYRRLAGQSVAVIVVSVLFGALIVAGREISRRRQLIQGITLFMVIGSDVLIYATACGWCGVIGYGSIVILHASLAAVRFCCLRLLARSSPNGRGS